MINKPTYVELEKKIQELEQAEEAHKQSEERYRSLVENTTDGYFICEIPSGKFLFLNRRACNFFGYTMEEGLKLTVWEVISPEDHERILMRIQARLEGKPLGSELNEYTAINKDGSKFLAEVSTSLVTHRGAPVVQGIIRDISERKQVEESIKASEERFRNIVNASPMGIHMYELQEENRLVFVGANKASNQILGVGQEQFIGKTIEDAFPGLVDTEIPGRYREAAKEGKIWRTEQINYEEGKLSGAFEVVAFQTEPNKMAALFNETTARKQAEEALRLSEERYRKFIENAPVAMYTVNINGEFTYGNKKLLEMTGYKIEDWLNKSFHPVVHPEDLEFVINKVQDRIEGKGTTDPYEIRIFDSSRKIIWVKINSESIYETDERGDKKLVGMQSFVEDVSDRRRAEEALRESEEKYRNILKNIDDGYFEVDIAGNFTFFNDSMCKILGYPKNELMGMNNREYMDEENAKKIFKAFNNVFRSGISTKALDWRLNRKDGTESFVETVVSLIKAQNGKEIGFRGVARAVTERKQLENQLQQAMRMESVGTLAGGIAHDFNNLLMGIQGRTSLALIDKDPSHPDFEHLKGIEDYVVSAVDLTKQLLGFARGGKYEVKTTDINEIIKKTSRMFGRTKKEIKIHTKHQKAIWAVETDQGQIEQVLMNLYVNAWQAMPDGGDLYIQTKNV